MAAELSVEYSLDQILNDINYVVTKRLCPWQLGRLVKYAAARVMAGGAYITGQPCVPWLKCFDKSLSSKMSLMMSSRQGGAKVCYVPLPLHRLIGISGNV
ncbi:hypothetical protein CRYUN_Cryun03dG0129400 [Craigia yunnanensis]